MRRQLFFIIAMMAFCVAEAQVSVTADLGFSRDGYSFTRSGANAFDNSLPRGWNFSFSPRAGYSLNDDVTVGLQLGVGYSDYTYTDGFFDPLVGTWRQSQVRQVSQLDLSAGAFVRMKAMAWGKLSLHAELLASYGHGFGKVVTTEYEVHTMWDVKVSQRCGTGLFEMLLTPVVNYAFTEHIGMDVYVNLLSLSYSRTRERLYGQTVPDARTNADAEIVSETVVSHFGVGVNALHTSLITLGVGYKF